MSDKQNPRPAAGVQSNALLRKRKLLEQITLIGVVEESTDGASYIIDPTPCAHGELFQIDKAYVEISPFKNEKCTDGTEVQLSTIKVTKNAPLIVLHVTTATDDLISHSQTSTKSSFLQLDAGRRILTADAAASAQAVCPGWVPPNTNVSLQGRHAATIRNDSDREINAEIEISLSDSDGHSISERRSAWIRANSTERVEYTSYLTAAFSSWGQKTLYARTSVRGGGASDSASGSCNFEVRGTGP